MRDIRTSVYKHLTEIDIWVVTYVDDEVADDFGSHVFMSKKEADEWAEWYLSDNEEGLEGTHRYVDIVHHRIGKEM